MKTRENADGPSRAGMIIHDCNDSCASCAKETSNEIELYTDVVIKSDGWGRATYRSGDRTALTNFQILAVHRGCNRQHGEHWFVAGAYLRVFVAPVPTPTKKETTKVAANGAFASTHHPNAVVEKMKSLKSSSSVNTIEKTSGWTRTTTTHPAKGKTILNRTDSIRNSSGFFR